MKLTCDVGWLDKVVRYGVSVILISLHLTGKVTGTIGILTLALARIILATGIFRFCPVYSVLGLTTCKSTEKARRKYE